MLTCSLDVLKILVLSTAVFLVPAVLLLYVLCGDSDSCERSPTSLRYLHDVDSAADVSGQALVELITNKKRFKRREDSLLKVSSCQKR